MDRLMRTVEGTQTLRRLALDQRQNPGTTGERGCTANVVLITPEHIWCANAGDCRAVLSRHGENVALSIDHKPDLPVERDRIIAAGCHVRSKRVNNKLGVSRAMGDFAYKKRMFKPEA